MKQLQLNDDERSVPKMPTRLEDVRSDVRVVRLVGLQPGATTGFDADSFNRDFDTAIHQIFRDPTWCCRSATSTHPDRPLRSRHSEAILKQWFTLTYF
jgi:hypothetical protein